MDDGGNLRSRVEVEHAEHWPSLKLPSLNHVACRAKKRLLRQSLFEGAMITLYLQKNSPGWDGMGSGGMGWGIQERMGTGHLTQAIVWSTESKAYQDFPPYGAGRVTDHEPACCPRFLLYILWCSYRPILNWIPPTCMCMRYIYSLLV